MWPGGGPTLAPATRRARPGYEVTLVGAGAGVSAVGPARSFLGGDFRRLGWRVAAAGQPRRTRWPAAATSARCAIPRAAGRPRAPTELGRQRRRIQAIEQRLACTCGCTLDIFTCRTTDFTCTYSPELHREVVALHERGEVGAGDPRRLRREVR